MESKNDSVYDNFKQMSCKYFDNPKKFIHLDLLKSILNNLLIDYDSKNIVYTLCLDQWLIVLNKNDCDDHLLSGGALVSKDDKLQVIGIVNIYDFHFRNIIYDLKNGQKPIYFIVKNFIDIREILHLNFTDDLNVLVNDVKNISNDNLRLEVLKSLYSEYIEDPEYVYKNCEDMYVIILKKRENTITNETRISLINPLHAKYRANTLDVVKVINVITLLQTDVTTCSSHNSHNEIEYRQGITVSTEFDKNINRVCSKGIHYFKSIDCAFYYRQFKDNFTGLYYTWSMYGKLTHIDLYNNGVFIKNKYDWPRGHSIMKYDEHLNGDKIKIFF